MEFSETRMLKYLLIFIGLLVIFTAVWASVKSTDFQYQSLQDVGGIVFGVMALLFGLKLGDAYHTKVSLMSGFILVMGAAIATRELCFMTSEAAANGGSITINVMLPFIGVVMGFILSGSSNYITGKKESKHTKKIWILVIFAFVVLCAVMIYRIYDLLPLYDVTPAFYAVLIGYLCYIAIFVYGIYAMLSYEIKYHMKIGIIPAPDEDP